MEVTKLAEGDPKVAERAWTIAVSTIGKRWLKLKKASSTYQLGFVVDADKVHRLAAPNGLTGVSVIPMLKEMGFGIDYVAYLRGDGPKLPAKGKADIGSKHSIQWFSDSDELHDRLKNGNLNAVYSEYFFDNRLTRAGVPQFSILEFEMGLRGALRSMRKLNKICKWDLYKH